MKTTLSCTLILLVSICATISSLAREISVNDADELKQALKSVQPGDVVVLRDGEWNNAKLTVEAEGRADQPITLRPQTPGGAVFTGQSSLRIGGEHLVISGLLFKDGSLAKGHVISFRANEARPARNCRVTECAIIDYNPASRADNSYWVSLYGVSNRVDHCRFEGKNDGSPTLTVWVGEQPNYHLIDHNYFLHRPALGRNGGETMRIGDSKMSLYNSRTTVEFNLLEDCSGEAEYISNKSCENIYRHNTFLKSRGALVLRHGNRNRVEGNWFLGHGLPGTGGVRIIGEDQVIVNNYFDCLAGTEFESTLPFVNGIPNSKPNEYFQIKRATVAFNTLVNCRENITFGVGVGKRNRVQPPQDCLIANNLVLGTNPPLIRILDQPTGTTWRGNIFYGAELGLNPTPGIRFINPNIIRGADGLWRPDSNSPARGGSDGAASLVTHDIGGRPRPAASDVGCFQLSEAVAMHKPMTQSRVGPAWKR